MIFKIRSVKPETLAKAKAQSEFIECDCGMTRKASKPCPFCGRGESIRKPVRLTANVETGKVSASRYIQPKQINRYSLVAEHEITTVPRGDHYMERG